LYSEISLIKMIPLFINHKKSHNFIEVRKQIIWGNKYIKYNSRCIINVNWIKSGIILINDISEYKIIAKQDEL
jgi:hypothetical protein